MIPTTRSAKGRHRGGLLRGIRIPELNLRDDLTPAASEYDDRPPGMICPATLTILVVTLLGACSGSTIVTETSSPRATGTDGSSGQANAGIGDTLTLHGIDSAVAVEVTVLDVVDPAKVGRFDQPRGDKHFWA
jgi:hypothetical protein